MKNAFTAILLMAFGLLCAQPNTEVYLIDITEEDGKITWGKAVNISNNEGYDNQPSFLENGEILFSSTRNGQTDIALYHIGKGTTSWLTNTPGGSEYSPLKVPDKNEISAVRLDTNGLQRLYTYDIVTGKPEELLKDSKVGYHVWCNDRTIICTVLTEDRMDLVVADPERNTHTVVAKNVGRSLHKIPNTESVSYISKENSVWEIRSLEPNTGKSEEIAPLLPETEDFCWLMPDVLISAQGNRIYTFDTKKDREWILRKTFEGEGLKKITRLAISPNGYRLALVAEE